MLYPSINELLKKVDSRYTLVMMASKRARQLMEGQSSITDNKTTKTVSIAIQEISEDRIGYTRPDKEDIENQEDADNILDANDLNEHNMETLERTDKNER